MTGDLGPWTRAPREVYAMRDPRTQEARYIGESHNAKARPAQHIAPAAARLERGAADAKELWLLELRAAGLRPVLEILQTGVAFEERHAVEGQWIDAFVAEGHRLFNAPARRSRKAAA